MDISIGGTGPLAASLSDDGLYAAHINGKELFVYSSPDSESKEVRVTKIKESSLKALKFYSSRGESQSQSKTLLTTDHSRISIWLLEPLQLLAEIESIEPGALNVEFGGNNMEILVFHAWNTKLTLHSLDSGRSLVIKTPKFTHLLGFGYRPRTKHLAILLKPDTSDLLTIHDPHSYEVTNRAVLPTVDAQGLKWSPDGRWIAVWDVASVGTKILIFTADGQLFRSYTGPAEVDDDAVDLGIKQIEWGPPSATDGASGILAIGKVNGNIDLLRTQTFSLSTTLSHVFRTEQYSPTIWRERFTSSLGDAEYVEASFSSALHMSDASWPPRGVSIMTFNSDGTLLATVDSLRSNVVWIWSLDPTTRLSSILVHEQPVRQLAWHSCSPQLLINTISNTLPSVRWWSSKGQPVISRVPTKKSETGKYDVKWLFGSDDDSVFWFGSTEEYVAGYLSAEDGGVKFEVLNSINKQGSSNYSGSMS